MPTQPASAGAMSHASRLAEVWDSLSRVTDPELDRSVTEMKFVSAVTLGEDGRVGIRFRLPTYWCAPNFAFMMADDMRAAVAALPWVSAVSVVLDEHMYAETINRGMAQGCSFADTFGEEADGNLDDVRRIFLLKAFQRRQEAMLLHLRDLGFAPDALARMTLSELDALTLDEAGALARTRYLERRDAAGPLAADALAFVTTEGQPLAPADFAAHLKRLRSVRVNAEFNGALCSGLLAARYEFDTTTPLKSQRPHS
ncbi:MULTISPECIES: iron-sulfur cluster assembly protein [Rhodomicrobium]|uniref:metal-sulfur cluster assembly factor n=1 Tax=Rhodomicrobium TaxID=1068 RepID=UPI000B4B7CD5|nr:MULTISPECIES: iron-sulfur cluster assembly protein [Rhodomicrobium]